MVLLKPPVNKNIKIFLNKKKIFILKIFSDPPNFIYNLGEPI